VASRNEQETLKALEAFINETIRRGREARPPYNPTIFIDMRTKLGTVTTIKRLVVQSDVEKSGFLALKSRGLLNCTIEAAVLEFPSLFTDGEREAAEFRLRRAGWSGPDKAVSQPSKLLEASGGPGARQLGVSGPTAQAGADAVSLDALRTGAEPARAGAQVVPPLPVDEAEFKREVSRLSGLSLEELHRRLRAHSRPQPPNSVETQVRRFERDPVVVALALKRAGLRCEVPECKHLTFETEDGLPYMEVHHIKPLAEGGADTADNVACICPAHHREAHHGRRADAIRAALTRLRAAVNSRAL